MDAAAPYVAVIGSSTGDASQLEQAEAVGRGLGEAGAVLVCGGLGGVMAAACRGARDAGGVTVGLLPGRDRAAANEDVTIAIATGLGELRNGLVAGAADAVIAVGGEYGTLSEIGFALRLGVPVVGLDSWRLERSSGPDEAIVVADDAHHAVALALALAGGRAGRAGRD